LMKKTEINKVLISNENISAMKNILWNNVCLPWNVIRVRVLKVMMNMIKLAVLLWVRSWVQCSWNQMSYEYIRDVRHLISIYFLRLNYCKFLILNCIFQTNDDNKDDFSTWVLGVYGNSVISVNLIRLEISLTNILTNSLYCICNTVFFLWYSSS
jgi:hypothetical protein